MEYGNLIEQVVHKEKGVRYKLNVALIIFGAIAIPATFVVISLLTGIKYLIVVAFFVLLFCIYGAWFFISSLTVDYEYAFLSSVLNINKVIAKRRRRKVVKVDVKRVDDIFRYTDKEMSRYRYRKVYHAAPREFSDENLVFTYLDSAGKRYAIVFMPDDSMLNGMKPYFNNELRKKLFVNKQL